MQAFRRRVLDMSHVEVETSAVEEKSSISWRFLVVAVMQVDRASIRRSEQIIFNLGRPQLRIDVRFFFTQKTAVFGFDSNDPIHCRQKAKCLQTITLILERGSTRNAYTFSE